MYYLNWDAPNPDEIIAEALQLLSKRDQYQQWVEDIGQKIDIAAQQLDRGEGIDGETAIAQLKARLQKKGLEIMRVVKRERGLDALFSENL